MTAEDEPFVDEQRRKLTQAGLAESFSIRPSVDRDEKLDFLRNPVSSVYRHGIPKPWTFVIEALAAGVPVVLPESGRFPNWSNKRAAAAFINQMNLAGRLLSRFGKPRTG